MKLLYISFIHIMFSLFPDVVPSLFLLTRREMKFQVSSIIVVITDNTLTNLRMAQNPINKTEKMASRVCKYFQHTSSHQRHLVITSKHRHRQSAFTII